MNKPYTIIQSAASLPKQLAQNWPSHISYVLEDVSISVKLEYECVISNKSRKLALNHVSIKKQAL